ncbi:hypothetical protein Poli38472_006467 [Pythium oligandrum]|uniref:Archease domain-containing protein n=1 Tax=Pythium oligandrum TaxID=41045 RepID=A0A8K1C5I9_PYTOL|nr:hypothetical protein Poli38472_006467 [Pythium oligandrum]|eukprot:TMW56457.1 hypothetical protein Poli38472_006467 [Pythium oligandrum]
METPLPPRTRRARHWRRPESVSVKNSPSVKAPVTSHPFEYLDHTADIQLHAWGSTLGDAFRSVVMCMFHYITDIETVAIDPLQSIEVTVAGHDLESLLFAFMDEFLFRFAADRIVCKDIEFLHVDTQQFAIQAVGQDSKTCWNLRECLSLT